MRLLVLYREPVGEFALLAHTLSCALKEAEITHATEPAGSWMPSAVEDDASRERIGWLAEGFSPIWALGERVCWAVAERYGRSKPWVAFLLGPPRKEARAVARALSFAQKVLVPTTAIADECRKIGIQAKVFAPSWPGVGGPLSLPLSIGADPTLPEEEKLQIAVQMKAPGTAWLPLHLEPDTLERQLEESGVTAVNLQPHRFSMLGLAALTQGSPIVAPDVPGALDLCDHRLTGFLFAPNDQWGGLGSSWGETLGSALQLELLRQTMIGASRAKAQSEFPWQEFVDRVSRLAQS